MVKTRQTPDILLGQEVAQALLCWFAKHRRPLPWREHYDPYEVWISEIMLQQTQMDRGVSYFLRWMARFPNVEAVARASEEDILHAWEGLGYYRRARFLHAAAKAMLERHGGKVPDSAADLEALPGLGAYTVAAIRAIAFNQDVVTIDANVERVFSRLLNVDEAPKKKRAAERIRIAATRLLPHGQARDYNQALMEFGALVCGKSPRCTACPVALYCESRRLGLEKERPVRENKPALLSVTSGHGVLLAGERVLVIKRPEGGLWGGLWEFPGADAPEENSPEVESRPEMAAKKAVEETFTLLGLPVRVGERLDCVRHGYTNHRLSAYFFLVEALDSTLFERWISDASCGEWVDKKETGSLAMPAHHRKLANKHLTGKKRPGPRQLTL